MTDRTYVPTSADALVRRVTALIKKDRGDRSVLQHSLGKLPKDAALGVHRIVVPFLPEPPNDRRRSSKYEAQERAYYAVAALIASQPRGARDQPDADDGSTEAADSQRGRRNLGYSLAKAADKGGNTRSLENRLQLLTRQDIDGLYRHLPRLILQLRGDQVRIDWGVLIRDLTRWDHDPRLVAKEWAQSYYRTSGHLAADRAKKNTNITEDNDSKETES